VQMTGQAVLGACALTAKINGIGETVTFDALGRMATASNPLGLFTYHYVNQTPRLSSVDRPGGQSVVYGYDGNVEDNPW